MSGYTYIDVYGRDGVLWIVFNRPDKLNSFNMGMMQEVIDATKSSEGYWAIVYTGRGRFFSAGIDLYEVSQSTSADEVGEIFSKLGEMFNTIFNVDKPIVIALNGDAYGGGAEFIWLGDIVIATKDAKIGWAEAKWGLIPPLLPLLGSMSMGIGRAQLIAYTSGVVAAKDLEHFGVISMLVESPDELENSVSKVLDMVKANSPFAFRSLKKYFRMIKLTHLASYGVSELERLSRSMSVVAAAKEFVRSKEQPTYEW